MSAKFTAKQVDDALADGIRRIWRECQDRSIWRSEEGRQHTIREYAADFRRLGLPVPG